MLVLVASICLISLHGLRPVPPLFKLLQFGQDQQPNFLGHLLRKSLCNFISMTELLKVLAI